MFRITSNPIKAVGLAILFHAIWNGSLWTIGVILQDTSTGIQILASLLITFILIMLLWTVLRRLVPFAVLEQQAM
jgi:ABC-type nickel/cobalt efflux system permease component RcnA